MAVEEPEQVDETGGGQHGNACQSLDYVLFGFMERDDFVWKVLTKTGSGTPTQQETEDTFKKGFDIQLAQKNDCGLSDQVSATATRAGRVSFGPQFASDGSCVSGVNRDLVSVVGYTDRLPTQLGKACIWTSTIPNPDEVLEADRGHNEAAICGHHNVELRNVFPPAVPNGPRGWARLRDGARG